MTKSSFLAELTFNYLIRKRWIQTPLQKPNEQKNYTHVNSDYRLSIIKQLPMSIKNDYYIFPRQKKFWKKLRHTADNALQIADTKKN